MEGCFSCALKEPNKPPLEKSQFWPSPHSF